MKRIKRGHFFAAIAMVAFGPVAGSCSKDDVTDPSAEGTGNAVVTGTVAATNGMVETLVKAFTSGVSASAFAAGGQGEFTAQTDIPSFYPCGTDGDVTYTESGSNFTAELDNCADEDVIIDGTLEGTLTELTCNNGVNSYQLPATMDAVFNGTVDVDGAVNTFSNFGMDITNIVYGSTCTDLIGGSFTAALTGNMSNDVLGIDFGSTLTIAMTDIQDLQVTYTIDGTITVDSPCQDGALTITTLSSITSFEGEACPASGIVEYAGDFGTAEVTFDGSCEFGLCKKG